MADGAHGVFGLQPPPATPHLPPPQPVVDISSATLQCGEMAGGVAGYGQQANSPAEVAKTNATSTTGSSPVPVQVGSVSLVTSEDGIFGRNC
jgi:hypothetical protein